MQNGKMKKEKKEKTVINLFHTPTPSTCSSASYLTCFLSASFLFKTNKLPQKPIKHLSLHTVFTLIRLFGDRPETYLTFPAARDLFKPSSSNK